MMAAGIGPGDEVITESRTFISVGDVIVLVGATPVFVDIDRETLNLDPADDRGGHHAPDARHHARPQQRPDVRHGRDRGHRPAARPQGHRRLLPEHRHHVPRRAGTPPSATSRAFSFVRNKSMTCGGEGGMVLTDDDDLAYRAQLLSNHGRGRHYQDSHDAELIGYNYRLSEVLSAIGRVQLHHVDDWNHERRTNTAALPGAAGRARPAGDDHRGARRGAPHPHARASRWCRGATSWSDHLRKRDIGVSPEYKLPIHLNAPYVQRFGFRPGSARSASRSPRRPSSCPTGPGLTRADVEYVVDAIEELFRGR